MKIIRNLKENNIYLIDNNKKIFETNHIGAEFVICIYTNEEIVITRNFDEHLYINLVQLMNNEYIFDNKGLSSKIDNEIKWFSDQYCNIDKEEETDMINRFVLKKIDDKIQITCENPYFKRNNIKKSQYVIAFSPNGNGFYSKNVNSGMSFQDDVILSFNNTLKKEYSEFKTKVYKRT